MARLASPITAIKDTYTVVVVGSGYGGAIAASRLSRTGQTVCVLERGKEFQPGEYPNTQLGVLSEFQMDAPHGHLGPRTGLYDLHKNPEISVLVGCGLGGTSLINANVAQRPDPRILADKRWPEALRMDSGEGGLLDQCFGRAEAMLQPRPYPETCPPLTKMQVLEKSAAALGKQVTRLPINVTFSAGRNAAGVEQPACNYCGDCVTGCNVGAKNTVLMNYLQDAHQHGAEIYTCVSVRFVERRGDKWAVHYRVVESGQERFAIPTQMVLADLVMLGAGALGSTEILLRSHAQGLPLSEKLGSFFTGNADVLGFAYNNHDVVNSVGFGDCNPSGLQPVGPTITGAIRIHGNMVNDDVVIEEGAIPGALTPFLAAAFAFTSLVAGTRTQTGPAHMFHHIKRGAQSLLKGPHVGATNHTQTFLAMGHDDGVGRMTLRDDRLRVSWPGVGRRPIFQRINQLLVKATGPLGGSYTPSPFWTKYFAYDLLTVHPLGGCAMADDANNGVVNDRGQVFQGGGQAVHKGLYVCDGAIIPRPLGVNPLLTISALAERVCSLLAGERGWTFDDARVQTRRADVAPKIGVQFTERMAGFLSTNVFDDYQRGASQGKIENCPLSLTVMIITDDLDGMLADPMHPAKLVGTLMAPALGETPLTVTRGAFNLLSPDPDPKQPGGRRMLYRMQLTSEHNEVFTLEGFKLLRGSFSDVWAESTTLYATLYAGAITSGERAKVLGKGVLHISPQDLARQLTSMKATNTRNVVQSMEVLGRFGRFFLGSLYATYVHSNRKRAVR